MPTAGFLTGKRNNMPKAQMPKISPPMLHATVRLPLWLAITEHRIPSKVWTNATVR